MVITRTAALIDVGTGTHAKPVLVNVGVRLLHRVNGLFVRVRQLDGADPLGKHLLVDRQHLILCIVQILLREVGHAHQREQIAGTHDNDLVIRHLDDKAVAVDLRECLFALLAFGKTDQDLLILCLRARSLHFAHGDGLAGRIAHLLREKLHLISEHRGVIGAALRCAVNDNVIGNVHVNGALAQLQNTLFNAAAGCKQCHATAKHQNSEEKGKQLNLSHFKILLVKRKYFTAILYHFFTKSARGFVGYFVFCLQYRPRNPQSIPSQQKHRRRTCGAFEDFIRAFWYKYQYSECC